MSDPREDSTASLLLPKHHDGEKASLSASDISERHQDAEGLEYAKGRLKKRGFMAALLMYACHGCDYGRDIQSIAPPALRESQRIGD